jgi:hypothetical protein
MPIVAPNYALELSIVDYLQSQTTVSGSLLSGSVATFYTGIGNVDLASESAVIVDASEFDEGDAYSRNYTFTVNITVKEIAADTTTLGTLAQAVFNEFVNSPTAKVNFTNPSYNIAVFGVWGARMRPSINGDALVNEITVNMQGALIPS